MGIMVIIMVTTDTMVITVITDTVTEGLRASMSAAARRC